jgi:peptidyl-prolyl cis-trans isomerase SurA
VDRIVAVVNDDIICLSQLNQVTLPYKRTIEASQVDSETKKKRIKTLEQQMLQQLIERALTTQEAEKYHIKVMDRDVDRAIDNFKKSHHLDQKGLEKALAQEGLTYQAYRTRMKEEILQSMLINRTVRSKVIITDKDIENYYQAHGEKFAGVKKYHLRNILLDDEAKIREVEKKLNAHVSFALLAKKYSMAPNAADGGDLGVFDINSFSRTIKESIKSLKKGEHTPVLETGQGYQILYVEDVVTSGGKSLEQARDEIQDILYQEKAARRFTEWVDSLKKHAHIKIML